MLLPFALGFRFLVVGPISWCVPPLRRLVLAWGSTLTSNHQAPEAWLAADRLRILGTELAAACLWWTLLALMATGHLPWRLAEAVLLGWVLAMALNQTRLLCNHRLLEHPQPKAAVAETLESFTVVARGLERLLLPLGGGFHALHHLAPSVPFHHLEEAHARLLRALPEDCAYRATVVPGVVAALADHVHMAGSREVEQPAAGAGGPFAVE
jgi:fatty acid desaturase